MTDTLLRALRDTMLDESESLAGLLRKCLLLGAETGSDALRDWARKELNGYGDDQDVPDYRKLVGVPISMDSISGNTWATGQIIDRHQLPHKAWEYVSDALQVRQPVEELEQLAKQKSLSFASPGLAYAQTIWNGELGPFQQISGLKFVLTGSSMSGLIGQIRTKLVDLIADLTADTPLTELPGKAQVDDAVSRRMGDVYTTTIHAATGPVAIGANADAKAEGFSIEAVLDLLAKVTSAAEGIAANDRGELEEAVADLRVSLEASSPDAGDIVKKTGRLRGIASHVGGAGLLAATEGATGAIIELALSGALG